MLLHRDAIKLLIDYFKYHHFAIISRLIGKRSVKSINIILKISRSHAVYYVNVFFLFKDYKKPKTRDTLKNYKFISNGNSS